MDYLDYEKREKEIEARFATYRNVSKVPYIIGLPLTLFWWFAIGSIVVLLMCVVMVVIHVWPLCVILAGANGGGYFVLKNLVKKYGDNFMDKIMAYNTVNTFTHIRVNRSIKTLLEKSEAK